MRHSRRAVVRRSIFEESMKVQALEEENALLLEALRNVAAAGRRLAADGRPAAYATLTARQAFSAAERVVAIVEGRDPVPNFSEISAHIVAVMAIGAPR